MHSDIHNFFDEAISLEDDELNNRISVVVEILYEYVQQTRKKIPENIEDEKLVHDENFIKWNVANLILLNSKKDEKNIGFNRLVYFMFEQVGRDVDKLVEQYSIKTEIDEDGTIKGYTLVILEEQTR